jgi:hypothetical protein
MIHKSHAPNESTLAVRPLHGLAAILHYLVVAGLYGSGHCDRSRTSCSAAARKRFLSTAAMVMQCQNEYRTPKLG